MNIITGQQKQILIGDLLWESFCVREVSVR